jgi:hypothetical protein
MSGPPLLWLILIFVVTIAISVVTGRTSLITVPAMLQFHIEPRTALATNMFALTFMSLGGAFPFLRGQAADRGRLPLLTALTLAGSVIGAFLLLLIPAHSVPIIISTVMIGELFLRSSIENRECRMLRLRCPRKPNTWDISSPSCSASMVASSVVDTSQS